MLNFHFFTEIFLVYLPLLTYDFPCILQVAISNGLVLRYSFLLHRWLIDVDFTQILPLKGCRHRQKDVTPSLLLLRSYHQNGIYKPISNNRIVCIFFSAFAQSFIWWISTFWLSVSETKKKNNLTCVIQSSR